MQLSISDARKQLPDLVRRAQRGEVVEIMVRGEVVAQLLSPPADADRAAERLLSAMHKLRTKRRPRSRDISTRKSEYLTRGVR